MKTIVKAILTGILLTAACVAQSAPIKVLPWNNHSAAMSLTFDDARAVHLDVAIPELNKRHMRASFFLIVSKLTRLDDWRKAQGQGHEIGNHTVCHQHSSDLTKETEELEVEDAKKFLDSNFHADVAIFAYPYGEISPGLLYWVKRYDFAARDGRREAELAYVKSNSQPDWYNLPSQPSYAKYDAAVYKSWVDKAASLQAWTTLQIHGIGDSSTGYEPIPGDTFLEFLDYLKAAQDKGMWVAPFGEVAAYFRAQKIVEAAAPQVANGETRLNWQVPAVFRHGVVLKVTASQPRARLYQAKHELRPDKEGLYSVAFDAGELVVRGAR